MRNDNEMMEELTKIFLVKVGVKVSDQSLLSIREVT